MDWATLLCKDTYEDFEYDKAFEDHEVNQFERDYESIVSSAAFRRLQDKTQVFPLAKSDFVRTRLTHSLEVSTIAKQLGMMIFKNTSEKRQNTMMKNVDFRSSLTPNDKDNIERILACAGLLHDIGNPPFGHAGEDIMQRWFTYNEEAITEVLKRSYEGLNVTEFQKLYRDFKYFDGNAQGVRILLKGKNGSQMKLSHVIISTLAKYPVTSDRLIQENCRWKKAGIFQSEIKEFTEISDKMGTVLNYGEISRHPLAYIIEAADDIAYSTADVEDAVKTGLIRIQDIIDELENEITKEDSMFYYPPAIKYSEKALYHLKKYFELNPGNEAYTMHLWTIYLRNWFRFATEFRFYDSSREIFDGTYDRDLFYNTYYSHMKDFLGRLMKRYIYNAKIIIEPELSAEKILQNFLMLLYLQL